MAEPEIPKEIKNKKLLVVEGKGDVGFFTQFLDVMNIPGVFVWGLDGKDNFNKGLPAFKGIRGFSQLTHLAVIRDRENENAYEKIKNILTDEKKMNCSCVPHESGWIDSSIPKYCTFIKVGIFIMPGNTIEGTMLEDLCLKTVEKHPAISCVEEFVSCVSRLNNPPKILSKVKVQAFLAAQPEMVNTVGLGAEKKYWNLDSPHLDELKKFLSNFK